MYRKVERDASRELVKSFDSNDSKKSKEAFEKKADQLQLKITASLVVDWSFDEKLTEAGVIEMLENAPHIRTQIENIAINRKEFFYKLSAID